MLRCVNDSSVVWRLWTYHDVKTVNGLEDLERAYTASPQDAEAARRYGIALAEAGRLADARKVLEAAVQSGSASVETCVRLGQALDALAEYALAVLAYDRAIAQDPLLANAHGFKAAALLRLGQTKEAGPSMMAYASLSSDPAPVHFRLASTLVDHDEFDAASNHLQISIDLRPDHVEAHQLLGIILGKKGHLEGSVAAWRTAWELDPDTPQSVSGLGVALSQAGRHEEAVNLLEKAVVKGATELCCLGRSYRETGRLEQSVEALNSAIKAEPEQAEPHYELGLTYLSMEATEDAIAALEEATQVDPTSPMIQHRLGLLYQDMGEGAKAMAALLKAADLAPEDTAVTLDLRRVQAALRGMDGDEAVRPPDTAGQDAGFAGVLDTVNLPNLLEFFVQNQSTGELVITSENGEAHLWLDGGRIAAATSPSVKRLGDALVELGFLTSTQLDDAVHHMRANTTLGQTLVEQSLITVPQLEQALENLIVSVLGAATTWAGGKFVFRENQRFTGATHQTYTFDTRFALMEVMRLLDEQNRDRPGASSDPSAGLDDFEFL